MRHLVALGALLVLGSTYACYQEKPPNHAESAKAGATPSYSLTRDPAALDSTSREITAFQLTTDALQRLTAAKRNVSALYARDAGVESRMRGSTAPKNLDEMAERINSEPEMRSALEQAGLSAHDYMISMIALQGAVKGYQLKALGKLDTSKVPPPVMANINFVGAHIPAVMQTMMPSGIRKPPTH